MAGRVAIVTGSSSGIGRATVLSFSERRTAAGGLVVTGRDADRVEAVRDECVAKGQAADKVLAVVADVTSADDRRRLVERTVEKFGRVDILVNNAGWNIRGTLPSTGSLDDFDTLMDVNVKSVMAVTQLCVPHLKQSPSGNVVNVSSVVAFMHRPPGTFYSMTKAALEMYTKCLAVELGPCGVRVNSVCPGLIDTPFFERTGMDTNDFKQIKERMSQHCPMKRVGRPEEIGNMIAFIVAEDGGSFCTGHSFVADGGILCMG